MNNGQDWTERTYEEAEEAIGYTFRDKELLKTCFTHKSYANNCGGESNERLEFLGDAVLQLAVTETLFDISSANEGKLTERRQNIVSEPALTEAERRAGFMRFLRYSGGEDNIEGKTPSNLVEAIAAGIYRDSGSLAEIKKFTQRFLVELKQEKDPKSRLQEVVQKRVKELPEYDETPVQEEGIFITHVSALGERAEGRGKNTKAAEMDAAEKLLQILTKKGTH